MEVSGESKSWREELASLVEDTGIRFPGDSIEVLGPEFLPKATVEEETESLKDQIKGFVKAWGEMVLELGRGCRDVVQQTVLTDDSYIVKKTKEPLAQVSEKLRFLNEFLPEDRDPVHSWSIIFFVSILALAVLSPTSKQDSTITMAKKVSIHPRSATRVLLPDGRYMAYQEIGVPPDKARYSMIIPHGFLSSRLIGVLGVKVSLLEEFGVRLISYDLPGFGESDPHHNRTLTSSAMDMSQLADSVGVKGKFWVLGYSTGSLHAWAALKYVPDKVAGAAMLAPFVNPYDASMTKEEMSKAWENWTRRRKLLYYLARRFPKLLNYFYHRTFLSGKHGRIEKWLAISLGKKDKDVVKSSCFEEKWQRDVEESIRQGSPKPFVEEAVLQVSNWGFSLMDLQVQRKCLQKGILGWLQFMSGQAECVLTGYNGPIHIWQGLDDPVAPQSTLEYMGRALPTATIHRLPEEGHFSYFSLCDECHRKIFLTLFGNPRGPVEIIGDENDDVDNEGL
ncbi:uncharacterized protein LOC127252242 [Andrographis paniculata]|uniref:uncharacterized protein LOC127252242 n=1 Tax=Andrographis paniculata TaxID=175694 RepID=UPI0021E6E00B|nr:uncharacterized protein LOC127252242 [Andrographis paniculata]XP_051132308.1 uncharacterized protein LOC127252242 [Andrographis paniculata]XP_051132309.1 uncharacterized protein LOC127252242 [Andrographis paniculata]